MKSRATLACVRAVLEQFVREAAALVVELQRGDAIARAGDLEVHVAHEVFLAGDVGEDLVIAVVAA